MTVEAKNSASCGTVRPGPCRRAPGSSARSSRIAVLAATALLAAWPAQAQETGVVRGTVTLVENGGLVDGAVILILGTGAFALTDEGAFEIRNVRPAPTR